MLYSCTHVVPLGVKGLRLAVRNGQCDVECDCECPGWLSAELAILD